MSAASPSADSFVARHFQIGEVEYDAGIRRRIPNYDEMLDAVCDAVAAVPGASAGPILDLGTGTGALAARLLARFPQAAFHLLDADAAILAQARQRLAGVNARVEFHEGSFADALPAGCRVAVASLALHHVRDLAAKQRIYANIRAALAAGGLFVNADPALPEAPEFEEAAFGAWTAHQIAQGFSADEVQANFALWRTEDRYFPLPEELSALGAAGFAQVEICWRRGVLAVLAAR
ncbi:MAG: methyltransferase domain-containing protein [Verrucomicrobia bacterium]|nr:methyltransferase domain-containing protein [Verrucomicrobiota bacterium]